MKTCKSPTFSKGEMDAKTDTSLAKEFASDSDLQVLYKLSWAVTGSFQSHSKTKGVGKLDLEQTLIS